MRQSNIIVPVWFALSVAIVAGAVQAADEKKSSEERIRAALTATIAFEFVETPLEDVVNYIKERHGIEIQIEKKALSEAGIGMDAPVSKTLRDVSLRSALRLMLRDLDLTYVLADEVLLITTPEEAESQRLMVRKVYDVRDLAPAPGSGARLVEDLTRHVASSSWDSTGGTAKATYFAADGINALIVTQTTEVHEEIEKLLSDLRKTRKNPAAEK